MVRFGLPHRANGASASASAAGAVDGAPAPAPLSPAHEHAPTSSGFFTLPMWKRRHAGRAASHAPELDEHGLAIKQPVFDKALPPTPPDSDDHHQLARAGGLRSSPSQLSLRTSRPGSAMAHEQPAMALAQASLGVGLPHVIGRASISSTTSDSYISLDRSAPDQPTAGPSVRRVQSSQRVLQEPHGPYGMQSNGSQHNLPAVDVTPPRQGAAVARRPSFWQRRRHDSNRSTREQAAKAMEMTPAPSPVLPSVLPKLPPVSPFNWDSTVASTSSAPLPGEAAAAFSPPRLVRRASDRRDTAASSLVPTSPLSAKESSSRRPMRRPSTADPSLDRPRAKSLYAETPSLSVDDQPLPIRTLPPPLSIPMPGPDEPPAPPPQPRQRTNSSAPLLRRLSVNLFSFGNTNTTPAASPAVEKSNSFASASPVVGPSPRNSSSKASLPIPKPNMDEEKPEEYLDRLAEAIPKADVAGVLASSGDDFYTQALRTYIHRFEFSGDSLDVAVRRLLMHVGLPRETQQIDRVMEAFAQRYFLDHRDLYASEDHPYILAFSLIMLHTDAFNKSNKRKMTKADYMKNTRLPGVPSEVLDCFYDNIVFAPFIFIEDPLDHRGASSESSTRFLPGMTVTNGSASTAGSNNGSAISIIGKSNKVDPYYLITNNLLKPLQVDVESLIPLEDPFSYHGSQEAFDEEDLRVSFAQAGVIEVSSEARRTSTSVFAVSVGGFPSHIVAIPEAEAPAAPDRDVVLKVANVGLLQRRDAVLEGGKRAPMRKWREWSVVLTASQLLFFRDPVWATHLQEQAAAGASQMLMPPSSLLRPDDVFSIKDAVAVYDRSAAKSDPNQNGDASTFILVMADGRQTLLRAPDEGSMNRWVSRINYASVFRSMGIRMRPLGPSGKDAQLMGVAAAKSHMRDLRTQHAPRQEAAPRVRAAWDARAPSNPGASAGDDAPKASDSPTASPNPTSADGMVRPRQNRSASIAFDAPTAPVIDGAQQFKATFDQVKADLAAGRTPSTDDYATRPRALSLESAVHQWPGTPTSPGSPDGERQSSRAAVVRAKIRALEERISAVQTELDADMRVLRNIAVLTPFQRATRDRLHVAASATAVRVRAHRLELARHLCQREVLAADILAEARDWRRNKFIALKAATDVLQTRTPPLARKTPPRLEDLDSAPPGTSSSLPTHMSESSTNTNESFHSALEFEYGTPTHDVTADGSVLTESPLATPVLEERASSSSSSFSLPQSITPSTSTSSSHATVARAYSQRTHSVDGSHGAGNGFHLRRRSSERSSRHSHGASASGHERFVTARESLPEEAEEWNKTRAANRVSLVRVPPDLRLSRPHARSPASLRSMPSSDGEHAAGFVPRGEYVSSFLA